MNPSTKSSHPQATLDILNPASIQITSAERSMASNEGNDGFVRAFIPGLVLGLIIGAFIGAYVVPLLTEAPKIEHSGEHADRPALPREVSDQIDPETPPPQATDEDVNEGKGQGEAPPPGVGDGAPGDPPPDDASTGGAG